MTNLFGSWAPFEKLELADPADATLPGILIKQVDVLGILELDERPRPPFVALGRLREAHGLDVITSTSMSQAHLGSIYREHILTRTGS